MNRTLLAAVVGATCLIAPVATAAPASATNGGGHAGRTANCVDTDREGTATSSLPILYSPAGTQIDTLAAGHVFDFCSNTATVSGSATYVYGEYLNSAGTSWLHGWMNQGQFKRIIRIA